MSISTTNLGKQGEDQAAAALQQAGYRIVCRNYRSRAGEIDIIAEKAGCCYFVEVKRRRGLSHGSAAEQVHAAKRQKIAAQAELYLAESGWQGPCGFLVVAIDGAKLEIIADLLW